MNYFSLLLITVIVLGFAASTVGRKYVVRTDRLHSYWRFLVSSLIASLIVSALGYFFKSEMPMRWQVWSSLIGGGFLIMALPRLAQSVVDFELHPSLTEGHRQLHIISMSGRIADKVLQRSLD